MPNNCLAAYGGNTVDTGYAGTILLLHMDDLTDNGPHALTPVLRGSATLSTAASKWGGKSLNLTGGVNDGFLFASDTMFNVAASDYTIEGWLNPADTTSGVQQGIFVFNGASGNQNPYTMITGANLYWRATNTGSNLEPPAAHGMPAGWSHIAQVKQGDVYTTYINGTRIATASSPGLLYNENKSFGIGGAGIIAGFKGYIDDVRLSNFARYTGPTCPVPTGPYPNS